MMSNVTRLFRALNATPWQTNSDEKDFDHPNGFSDYEVHHAIAICVVNFVLCFTALFANLVVILVVWKTSSLHSPANSLLTSLAVSDFAVGLIAHPLFIVSLLTRVLDFSAISPRTLWVAFNIVSTYFGSTSLVTVTAIGIDRLLALELHLRYQDVVTLCRVRWIVIFIWALCGACSTICVKSLVLYYQVAGPVIVILLLGNFVVYLKIYLIVRRHKAQIQQVQQLANRGGNAFSLKRFKKSATNTFLVYILLLCCFIPQSFVAIALFKSAWEVSFSVEITTGTIVLLNSSLNPVLYCWRLGEIRSAFKRIFCG